MIMCQNFIGEVTSDLVYKRCMCIFKHNIMVNNFVFFGANLVMAGT